MKKMVINFLAVGGAGCLGAMARYAVGLVSGQLFKTTFPVGTLIINISGSFFLGWFMTMTLAGGKTQMPEPMKLAIAVGFTGAYTTFSTLMYESNALLGTGSEIKATLNLFGSLLVGLLAVRLGIVLGQKW